MRFVTCHLATRNLLLNPSTRKHRSVKLINSGFHCSLTLESIFLITSIITERWADYPRQLYSLLHGVGHSVASVCLVVFVHALKGKRLELSEPKSVDTWSMAAPRSKGQRSNPNPIPRVIVSSKGKTASPGVGLHVDMHISLVMLCVCSGVTNVNIFHSYGAINNKYGRKRFYWFLQYSRTVLNKFFWL